MSDCKSTINGGLVFGTESAIDLRYVRLAATGIDCRSPTDPHLLQGVLSFLFG